MESPSGPGDLFIGRDLIVSSISDLEMGWLLDCNWDGNSVGKDRESKKSLITNSLS